MNWIWHLIISAEELKSLPNSQKLETLGNLKHKSAISDLSLNYSPIRKMGSGDPGQLMSANEDTFYLETEDDARRSSTPTLGCRTLVEDSSLHFDCSHVETKDAASRINNMWVINYGLCLIKALILTNYI